MSIVSAFSVSHPILAANAASQLDVALRLQAATADVPRRALNLSLVLDRSGSMGGNPLYHAIEAAKQVVDHLTPQDRLNVVIYDDKVDTLVSPTLVTDPAAIKRALDKVRAGGLTNLSGGWLRGADLVKASAKPGSINRVLMLTDGQANEGITDTAKLVKKASEIAAQEIVTTTLGFGNYFNEDLLIGMADAAGGNFYFIQSHDDAGEVFRIEIEGLATLVASKVTVSLRPAAGFSITEVLNNYPTKQKGDTWEVEAGEVYGVEPRAINLAVRTDGVGAGDAVPVLTATYHYQKADGDGVTSATGDGALSTKVGTADEAAAAERDLGVIQEAARLRIGRLKEEATALADAGNVKGAGSLLRDALQRDRAEGLDQSFEFAEELDLLEHYAAQLEKGQFGTAVRKEIKDQSYQARSRGRADLKMRALSDGSTEALDAVTAAAGEEGAGVVLECVREGGKLRIKVVSDGYESTWNVQFPRALRQQGARYLAEGVEVASGGGFYRATGKISLLLRPGESRPSAGYSYSGGSSRRRSSGNLGASKAVSLAQLKTTTDVGDGVLVQIVKDGSKLRARVVSDGYDPNKNMRFPRQVREEGRLFVVDEVRPSADGSYYMTYGEIKVMVQPGQAT